MLMNAKPMILSIIMHIVMYKYQDQYLGYTYLGLYSSWPPASPPLAEKTNCVVRRCQLFRHTSIYLVHIICELREMHIVVVESNQITV